MGKPDYFELKKLTGCLHQQGHRLGMGARVVLNGHMTGCEQPAHKKIESLYTYLPYILCYGISMHAHKASDISSLSQTPTEGIAGRLVPAKMHISSSYSNCYAQSVPII